MRRAAVLVALVLLSGLAPARAATPRPRMLVMTPKAGRDVDDQVVRLLDDVLLTELSHRTKFEVLGGSDLARLLDLETKKQLVGCDRDACLAEVGGALGAEFLAATELGRVGHSYVVNLKVIDVHDARAVGRWSETVPDNEDALAQAVRRSVAGLYPTSTSYAGWSATGVAVVAAGLGAYLLASTLAAADRRDRATTALSYDAAQADAVHSGAYANVAFGVAGAAAVCAVVLFAR